ncbi:MAG: hypothetical protein ISR58_07635 [Anaerolineales bacterium]|nr:hypothetical protein [Chloroflexota bacterium]MBL6981048.1 hypothetical protein [Anaerolineales bacterium]
MQKQCNANEALALGAISAGVSLTTGYPGTPGTDVMDILIDYASNYDIYVEWSTNERVALEVAIGASIAGKRSLVCTKSVGMNVMLDPLMCLNLTGVHAGLVILLGDDPGAYGSQNDQDTRNIAHLVEIPVLEPTSVADGYAMMRNAFELSERFNTAIIIRITRSFSQQIDEIHLDEQVSAKTSLNLARDKFRFVPYPGNAVEMHRKLHDRLKSFQSWAENAGYNTVVGSGKKGILAVGFVYNKLVDVLGESNGDDLKILNLGCLYPLPKRLIAQFLDGCEKILVLEEIDPYIENQLKAIAFEQGFGGSIRGKLTGDVSWEGELFRWQIIHALETFIPDFKPGRSYLAINEISERPIKKNHCAAYPYEDVLDLVKTVAYDLRIQPFIIADPGCMVKVADQLDAKYAIGSAVAVASGIDKAGTDEKIIAFFGDSAFFHSAIPAICNASYNQSDMLIILLDNNGAASTGLQPTPGVGSDAFGNPAPKLDIPEIARACGVEFVQRISANLSEIERREVIREGINFDGLAMIMIEVRFEE